MSAKMSSTRQTVIRFPSFSGLGNRRLNALPPSRFTNRNNGGHRRFGVWVADDLGKANVARVRQLTHLGGLWTVVSCNAQPDPRERDSEIQRGISGNRKLIKIFLELLCLSGRAEVFCNRIDPQTDAERLLQLGQVQGDNLPRRLRVVADQGRVFFP
jgi:hypothetical protein